MTPPYKQGEWHQAQRVRVRVSILPFPNRRYGVIYCDPPWRYNFSSHNADRVERHYPTMALEEIKALPVNRISTDKCILYLWSTAPKLKEALEVMESWGFEYKTHCIWDKLSMGMGYWFRGQHELLLVGTKGKASPPSPSQRISSVIPSKKRGHSVKPDEVREHIRRWFPNSARIELFARKRVEGWDAWGDELS